MSKPKHILVIRLSAMGDVAMTVPVLRAFTRQYPDVKLTVLTKTFFKPFFKSIPHVATIGVDIKGKHKGIFGLYRLSKELMPLNFDAIADIHNVIRSQILRCFIFGKQVAQIDKGRQEKKALVSGQSFKQLKTTHQRYADVFETLGYPLDLSQPKFPKRKELNDTVIKIIGKDSKAWIGIAPFAAFEGKMYPMHLMTAVIEQLSKTYKVLLFGAGNHEKQTLEAIASASDNVVNLAGLFSLSEELEIMSNLDVMLAMDSGNAHMAAMLGVKVITLWGVTHPYAGFLPFNHDISSAILANRVLYPKIPTSIYGNTWPEGYEKALGSIAPNQIVTKVQELLN